MKNTKKNTRHTQLGFQRPIQMQKAQFHHSECKLRNFSKTKNDLFLTRRAPLSELDVRFVFSLSPTTLNSSRLSVVVFFIGWPIKPMIWFFVNSTCPFNRNSTSGISIKVYLASPSARQSSWVCPIWPPHPFSSPHAIVQSVRLFIFVQSDREAFHTH